MMTSFQKLLKRSNDAGISFITLEIDLAMQLLTTASTTHDEVRQQRLRKQAREAYDTVLRCIPHLHLTESQEKDVKEHLEKVRKRLEETTSVVNSGNGRFARRWKRSS